jgi:hypothetical protein
LRKSVSVSRRMARVWESVTREAYTRMGMST